MEPESYWRSRTIAEAQAERYSHVRATCSGCGRITDIPWNLLLRAPRITADTFLGNLRPKRPRRPSLALGDDQFPTRPRGIANPRRTLNVQWVVPVGDRELQRVFFFRPAVRRGKRCAFQFYGVAFDNRLTRFKVRVE